MEENNDITDLIRIKQNNIFKELSRKIKVYLAYFKLRFLNEIQYKVAAFAGVLTQFAWGAMYIMLYTTFLKNGTEGDYTIPQISTYIWMQQAFLMMFNLWRIEPDILEACKTGNISMELVKPVDLYSMWHAKTLGKKLAMTILRALPILVICSMPFLGKYKIMMCDNFITFILFICALVLSALLLIAYSMLMCSFIMKTISSQGIRLTFQLIMEFCSGAVIPIAFMPEKVIQILKFTPFYYMQNVAFNIYNGYISNVTEIVQIILLQIAWITILTIIGRRIIRKQLSKIVVQGG